MLWSLSLLNLCNCSRVVNMENYCPQLVSESGWTVDQEHLVKYPKVFVLHQENRPGFGFPIDEYPGNI